MLDLKEATWCVQVYPRSEPAGFCCRLNNYSFNGVNFWASRVLLILASRGRTGLLPDVFPADQGQQAEVDHVPRGAVLVPHQVQRHGNVRVTVIAAEVVLLGTNSGD